MTEAERKWLWLACVCGMLLVPGCKNAPENKPNTTAIKTASPSLRSLAGTPAKVSVTTAVDTTRKGDTTFIHRATRYDSTWTLVSAPAIREGLAYGIAAMPVDSLCPAPMGFNTTLIAVDTELVTRLAKVKQCGGRIVLRPARNLMIGPPSVAHPQGCINADSGSARVRKWPWPVIREHLASGRIVAIEIIDDVAKVAEWCLPVAGVLRQSEQVACVVRDSAPGAPVMMRALPTQMQAYAPYICTTTARPQYAGPAWYGNNSTMWHPDSFVAIQGKSAAKQKLGIMYGLNLWTGCGPTQWQAGVNRNLVRNRCLPGVPGTSILEHGWYAPSASEILRYGLTLLRAPKSCGQMMWAFTYAKEQLARPEIRAALTVLADSARNRPATNCIQR